MIIALDETGSFHSDSNRLNFYSSATIRSEKKLYQIKADQFEKWESTLSPSLKSPQGEFKSSVLPEAALYNFVRQVAVSKPYILIDAVAIKPIDNPENIIDKYKMLQLMGIEEGIEIFKKQGKEALSSKYNEFKNWYSKLNYQQFVKLQLLGQIISSSYRNSFGTAISSGFDDELVNTKFILDKDHIRGREQNSFWREILRNQMYSYSVKNPLPLLDEWQKTGHPFLDKYGAEGFINLNRLFWKNCSFEDSKSHFELRIADAVNTILSTYHNDKKNVRSFSLLKHLFMGDQKITGFLFHDFNLDERWESRGPNPWSKLKPN